LIVNFKSSGQVPYFMIFPHLDGNQYFELNNCFLDRL
jgi:hypothetical protein